MPHFPPGFTPESTNVTTHAPHATTVSLLPLLVSTQSVTFIRNGDSFSLCTAQAQKRRCVLVAPQLSSRSQPPLSPVRYDSVSASLRVSLLPSSLFSTIHYS